MIDIMDSLNWEKEIHSKILVRFQERALEGSGWNFRKVIGMNMAVTKFQPLKAATYITLQDDIKAKKAVIIVQNKENKCFV